jgi:hypothetical protein
VLPHQTPDVYDGCGIATDDSGRVAAASVVTLPGICLVTKSLLSAYALYDEPIER